MAEQLGPESRRVEQTKNAREAFAQTFPDANAKSDHYRRLAFRSGQVRRQNRIDRLVAELEAEREKLRTACAHRFPDAGSVDDTCTYCGVRYVELIGSGE